MNFHRNLFATAVAVILLAACGSNDGGDDDGEVPRSSESSQSETMPSSLSYAEYNRLRDAIDNDEVSLRVIPRIDPGDRLEFDDVDTASEKLNDAVADGDFAAADRVFASVPARWRNELTNRANDAAADAYDDGDYATAYRFDRYLHIDNRAFWILTAEYVNGRVVDKGSSTPVENAVVSYTERSYPQSVQTDSAGSFRILLPASRPSGLTVEHPDYDSKRVFDIETGGQTFTISMGTGFPKLTFRGRVVDAATGEAIAGFPVVAGFDPIEGAPEVNMQQAMGKFGRETDANGRFEITELPTNVIHVIAQGPHDGKLYMLQEQNVTFVDGVEQIIEVSIREVRLDVPLIVVGTVRDRATGEAVANVRVSAGGWKAENTDVNGRFMVQLETGRDWQLTATHPAYHTSQPQAFISATPKTIETEFLIDPITTGTILGTAVNSVTGEPLANVVIEIAGQRIRTDSRGQFRAEEIESGEITVNASQSGFRADSEALLLEALQTAEATLELEPITTGIVSGIVIDKTSGEPVVEAAIRAGDKSGMTGEDGRFRLEEVEAGVLVVAATKALYEPGSDEVELVAMASVEARIELNPITWGTVRGIVRHAVTDQPLANATVRIGSIEVTTDGNGAFVAEKVPAGSVSAVAAVARYHDAQSSFELPRDGEVEREFRLAPITTGNVLVTVRDAGSNAPIPGATVMIGALSRTTDSRGRVEAAEIPAGQIVVNATANLYEPGSAEAPLEAAGEVSVDIELTAITYGTIFGKVVDKSSDAPIANVPIRIGGQE